MAKKFKLEAPDKKIVRGATYVRVSIFDQARKQCTSLESQRDICGHVYGTKKELGWTETRLFTDTQGGDGLDRTGLQAMMDSIRKGEIDVVVVYKLDCLSRSIRDYCKFLELLEKHGVQFFSATEGFDTKTPTGRLLLSLMMVFAEFEQERIAERTAEK